MEADLSRYYRIDYRDRWRRDAQGRRLLTLRMIAVRVRFLPPASATARALGGAGWDLGHYLMGDLFHAMSGKPHPGRPVPKRRPRVADPARARKLLAARTRAREHRQRLQEEGEG